MSVGPRVSHLLFNDSFILLAVIDFSGFLLLRKSTLWILVDLTKRSLEEEPFRVLQKTFFPVLISLDPAS